MQVSRLSHVLSVVPGVAKCPYSPHHNASYIMTSDDNFYTATVTDFTARDPAIYRMMGSARNLRTVQYNSRWLNGDYNNTTFTKLLLCCCYGCSGHIRVRQTDRQTDNVYYNGTEYDDDILHENNLLSLIGHRW